MKFLSKPNYKRINQNRHFKIIRKKGFMQKMWDKWDPKYWSFYNNFRSFWLYGNNFKVWRSFQAEIWCCYIRFYFFIFIAGLCM